VIPVFNEEESIEELYREICETCRVAAIPFELIFVDDGSRDKSFSIVEKLHKQDKRVRAIQFRTNCGKSEALAAGFSQVRGKWVLTMDADLQDNPAEIPALIEKLEEGFDLVSGWKKHRKDPVNKKWPSRIYNRITSILTGIKLHDFNCGLKLYRREVVEAISVYGELHRYIPVLAAWEGFRIAELPVRHRKRKFGKTKYGMSRYASGFFDLVTVMFFSKYTRRPLHLFGFIGMALFFPGAEITIYLIVLRVTRAVYLSNRPLLFIGVMLIMVGVQFFSIGLLGEMMARSQATLHTFKIKSTLGD